MLNNGQLEPHRLTVHGTRGGVIDAVLIPGSGNSRGAWRRMASRRRPFTALTSLFASQKQASKPSLAIAAHRKLFAKAVSKAAALRSGGNGLVRESAVGAVGFILAAALQNESGGLRGGLKKENAPEGAYSLDFWRRRRDSNPRYGEPYTGFRVRRIRPLCHLSCFRVESRILAAVRARVAALPVRPGRNAAPWAR